MVSGVQKIFCSMGINRAFLGSRLLEAALAKGRSVDSRKFDQDEQLRVPHFPWTRLFPPWCSRYMTRASLTSYPEYPIISGSRVIDRISTRVCSFGLRLSIGAPDLSMTYGNERSMMALVVRFLKDATAEKRIKKYPDVRGRAESLKLLRA